MTTDKSVNWCDIHRTQFPCDRQCSQCLVKFREELLTISWEEQGRCAGADTRIYSAHLWPHVVDEILKALQRVKL